MNGWVPLASPHELWLIVQFVGILFCLMWLAVWRQGPCKHEECRQKAEEAKRLHSRLVREDEIAQQDKLIREAHAYHDPKYPISTCRLCPGGQDPTST